MTSDKWQVTSDKWQVCFYDPSCHMFSESLRLQEYNRVNTKWQVTSGKGQVTSDKWQVTSDKWQVTCDKWHVCFYDPYGICFCIPWDSRSTIEWKGISGKLQVISDTWQVASYKWQMTSLLLWPILSYFFGFLETPGV